MHIWSNGEDPNEKKSEYDQEIPHALTADNPMA